MGRCQILKHCRKELNLNQQQFADKVGVSLSTIARLEQDETAWLSVRPATEDKIQELIGSVDRWGRKHLTREDKTESKDETKPIDVPKSIPIGQITPEMMKHITKQHEEDKVKEVHNSLNGHDKKTLTLIEFAYEGLVESTTHEEFVVNINMIKRILNKY